MTERQELGTSAHTLTKPAKYVGGCLWPATLNSRFDIMLGFSCYSACLYMAYQPLLHIMIAEIESVDLVTDAGSVGPG